LTREVSQPSSKYSVFKGVLADHLELPNSLLERSVFPDSSAAPPMKDLIRG